MLSVSDTLMFTIIVIPGSTSSVEFGEYPTDRNVGFAFPINVLVAVLFMLFARSVTEKLKS